MSENVLTIEDLRVHYVTAEETVQALNGIELSIDAGESIGLVGETGAGKTTTAMAVMRLVPQPPGRYIAGKVDFFGENLLQAEQSRMRAIRGDEISMIFQDPMTAVNPRITVVNQIAEVIKLHRNCSQAKALRDAAHMLQVVGIDPRRGGEYPHQFSGGMKQRVIIAIALACQPKLLIADEPTTALDVTIQAQVLKLMRELKKEFQTSLLMISHDLGVVAETCEKVAIIYAGEVLEFGDLAAVFNRTKHPYTRGLFDSIPALDKKVTRLKPISGETPNPAALPDGCKFSPRCERAQQLCFSSEPATTGRSHRYRCHFPL